MPKQVIKKKKFVNVGASPQGHLIVITKQRFALNSTDAVEIDYYPERLKIRYQTPNNRSFVLRLWRNIQRNSYQLKRNDLVINWAFDFRGAPNPNSWLRLCADLAMTNH